MDNIYQLEGAYLIASPNLSLEGLQGALVYIYQVDRGVVSGIVMNKPFSTEKKVGDFLEYPKNLFNKPVWQGGPMGTDRLIAFSQYDRDVYITDRLTHLTPKQLQECLFVVGQCVWDISVITEQIKKGDWWLVGSRYVIPNQVPADNRIPYLLKITGINHQRYVPCEMQEMA